MRLPWYLSLFVGVVMCLPSAAALAQDKKDDAGLAADAELVETRTEVPRLKAAAEYKMKDNVLEIELSEYAGYSGLVAANNGFEPSDDSIFFKKYGFKVRIKLSEEESWSALNSGKMAASATTTDVLAVYGRQLDVVVPMLLGFSRGADGIVVRSDIKRINDLKGKVIAASQFTEADFFIRYLAQESGMGVTMLPNLAAKADPDKLNLVYCSDAFGAGDLFLRDVKAGRTRLAGCATWAPKTTEVAGASNGQAKIIVTNRNLLIISDVLMINKAFAKANPKIVEGLVAGILEGNNAVRTAPDKYLAVIGKCFKWSADQTRSELAKVHLANLPENKAFFDGTLDSAGTYGYIYETSSYLYGSSLLGRVVDSDKLLYPAALKECEKLDIFKGQKAEIAAIKTNKSVETKGPDDLSLLSKDIRFTFQPNSSKLDGTVKDNAKGLDSIKQLLMVSPGSTVLLRGHADGSLVQGVRDRQGDAKAREMLVGLKVLSKARCAEIKQILQEKYKLDDARIESIGVGAEEPTGKGPDADRRVEVQWFTVE